MPGLSEMFTAFGRIGLLSFGGPAAQIAVMHKILVEEKGWLDEDGFLRALSFCMVLPGPEAMQLATYAGWRLRGVSGGLLAGLLFVVPGACVIAALAAIYIGLGDVPLVQTLFLGVKAAVVAILAQALWKLSRKALTSASAIGLAIAAFIAMTVLGLPFPIIVATAALLGAVVFGMADTPTEEITPSTSPTGWLTTVVLWGGLWAAPLLVLWMLGDQFLFELALFFGKLALVTFGGAYAVLAYMTQEVVQEQAWLNTAQMMDALGLAETTPGPLILVTQFVGHLAGYSDGGVGRAAIAGVLTLWMTFTPCFLWIFAGAPYLERITGHPRIAAALRAVTAAVVGAICSLGLWFAGALYVRGPHLSDIDLKAIALTVLAAVILFVARRGIAQTLAITALAAWGISFL